jgi:asparagine synthase (glutamine-hydrolysing)
VAAARPEDLELIRAIRSGRLTYLSEPKLASIAQTVRTIEETGLPGTFIEAGCALGGSAILIATLKGPMRPFAVYDVFGMIPAPSREDTEEVHDRYRAIVEGEAAGLEGDTYYGYMDDLYDVVRSNLASFGIGPEDRSVALVKGLVQDTMAIEGPVAFAHVDVDWYEPVKTCLERIFPNLVVGGSIILDDYHYWGGCRKATEEYLGKVQGQFARDDSASSLKITRTRA